MVRGDTCFELFGNRRATAQLPQLPEMIHLFPQNRPQALPAWLLENVPYRNQALVSAAPYWALRRRRAFHRCGLGVRFNVRIRYLRL